MPKGNRLYNLPKQVRPTILDYYAQEFIGYIKRRKARVIDASETTLSDLCRRFRMNQREALMVVNSTQRLVLSGFAYRDVEEPQVTEFSIFIPASQPVECPDAPKGQRIVMVFEDNWEEERERITDPV